jgi:hypothetical protein
MKKKAWIALFITISITVISYLLYPILFCSISIVKVESEGSNTICYLQWRGNDQAKIGLTALADQGRTNAHYSEIVNNGEVFTVPVKANYSWVEISFNGRTVSLHSDGKNATLTPIGYS